ncbi:hypothetical protein HMPREF0591_1325 [Mycobacterium parascrofulaceum ATCC BAA-614]|uniref:Uncharacterized protein n=1 Tax=Mycobacterium parascrofulaceum ATCC BAA-614 TaxID=525368 RepID=D5P581_9MYCO|nr:hypothetical protein HMPREF0591_1325 [Mycobacterium parascrofulaceum ATCC BAA-614]
MDLANDVIGADVTGGTPAAAAAPAAKPRPKSIPSDGIGEPCNPAHPAPWAGLRAVAQ